MQTDSEGGRGIVAGIVALVVCFGTLIVGQFLINDLEMPFLLELALRGGCVLLALGLGAAAIFVVGLATQ